MGKKASELRDRMRGVARGQRPRPQGAAPEEAPPARRTEPAPPAPGADGSGEGAGAPRSLYGGTAPARAGRKARAGLEEGEPRRRFTLDLTRDQHAYLKMFALQADTDMSAVLRVLVSCLQEDDYLAKEVRVRAQGG